MIRWKSVSQNPKYHSSRTPNNDVVRKIVKGEGEIAYTMERVMGGRKSGLESIASRRGESRTDREGRK